MPLRKISVRSSHQASVVVKLTNLHPWPRSVGYGSGVAMSCGVGCRCGSDLVVAVEAGSCSSDLTLRLGTSICYRFGSKIKKKKKKKKKFSIKLSKKQASNQPNRQG